MPLIRRVPKYGFTNPFRKEYAIVNIKSLADLPAAGTITPQAMVDAGLVKRGHIADQDSWAMES